MHTPSELPPSPPDQSSGEAFSHRVSVWLGGARLIVVEPVSGGRDAQHTDVTGAFARLVAAGLALDAGAPAAAPPQRGAVASDGRVTAATATLVDADGRCVVAVRWPDGSVEVLDHHGALVAASRAMSEIIDPPPPRSPLEIPLGG